MALCTRVLRLTFQAHCCGVSRVGNFLKLTHVQGYEAGESRKDWRSFRSKACAHLPNSEMHKQCQTLEPTSERPATKNPLTTYHAGARCHLGNVCNHCGMIHGRRRWRCVVGDVSCRNPAPRQAKERTSNNHVYVSSYVSVLSI